MHFLSTKEQCSSTEQQYIQQYLETRGNLTAQLYYWWWACMEYITTSKIIQTNL